ncbi:MAG: chloramphenicol acetyltransferase [Sediminimonas qiaohouensis]|uniref:Chloramphenicol acetyltransferase n=1 Tax=Sediminimonas qiaohouensis TaxID=552061 RepID=A0A7C9L8B8_9RHOB|nr:chloramphenicol acetyltransferase [Sediminimonas qiaohouensis]MTJ05135.1 chloramphenicol acetyltransferase [Sediminimonas qiaohouensis]
MPRLSADTPFIHPDVEMTGTTLGRYTEIGRGSRIVNATIGDYSYTDRYAEIANAEIAKFANIAAFSRIGPTDHPLHTASLHHFLYRSADYFDETAPDTAFFEHRASRRAHIGNDTWIGHGAVIMPEVTLHDGAVVAAGAVVTRDVAPYTIVAGVPARPLKARQPQDIADRLIALAWWDWPHERLHAALQDFRTLPAAAFLDKHEG